MKGEENIAERVPELKSGPTYWIIGLVLLTLFAITLGIMRGIDLFLPDWSFLGQVITISIGYLWSAQFYWRRKEFLIQWGSLAYRNAFVRHMLIGVPVMFAAIAHTVFLPGGRVLSGWLAYLEWLIGLYLVVTGVLLYIRSYVVFGIDYLAALYVYFPSQARLVNLSIYRILRHPAYSGIVRIGLALGLIGGTWPSIVFGLLMPMGLGVWIMWVEEPELVERFGASYLEYRKRVPAFRPRMRDLTAFLRFLITGNLSDRIHHADAC